MRRGVLLCALATGCSAKECLTDADCTDREATCDRRRACDGGDSPSWSDADGNRTCAWVREDPSGRCAADGSEPRLEVECNDQGGCAYLVELEASPASAACCESCRLGSCEEPKRRRKTSRRLRTLFAAVFLLYAAGVVAALLLVAVCVFWCRVVSRASAAVWKSNLQPDFNVRVCECFNENFSASLRELDESNRSVQKSAESTSI